MAKMDVEVARIAGGPAGWISVLIPLALFIWLVPFVPQVAAGNVIFWGVDWVPSLGVRVSFMLDGLSLTFALLITGIGAAVTLYSASYLGNHPQYPRFVLFLLVFMAGMLGLVVSDNLISLFVFWEITTISSYLLIGFKSDYESSRRAALQALLVTGAGALAMLAGIIMLGHVAGTFELSVILTMGDTIRADPLYLPIAILFLAGAFTKSAQFPFHFWLPNAMAAPTPVSAYLHSATMVKAGVFLMARMNPALGGTDFWFWTLVIFGGFTAVFASVLALRQSDIKQVLAYTTLMALGTLTMYIGVGTPAAITGMMLFLVVHSFYKAALFLMIGIVDHRTGTRETGVLRGLSSRMPLTAIAAGLAALSMAGIAPLIGFIGKEFLYKAALDLEVGMLWVTGTSFVAAALMFAVAGVVALRPFFGPLGDTPKPAREGPSMMLAGPLVLGGLGLFFGLFPNTIEAWLIAPGTWAITGNPDLVVDIFLWKGVNAAFYLSLVTFAVGALIYAAHQPLRAALARLFAANPIKFDPGWDRLLDGLKALAAWQTNILQSGLLQRYIATVFVTLAVAIIGTIWAQDALDFRIDWRSDLADVQFRHWMVVLFVTAGALMAATTSGRMTAIAALGVVGVGVALIYIMFGAPDVAITQLLVEMLVVVLVAVAMLKMPKLNLPGQTDRRPWHMVLSAVVGISVSVVVLAVLQDDLDRRLTDYFEITSWPEAYGRNIVNVILVDFRALDTFGEIAVVVVAALSAYALLRGTLYARTEKENADVHKTGPETGPETGEITK